MVFASQVAGLAANAQRRRVIWCGQAVNDIVQISDRLIAEITGILVRTQEVGVGFADVLGC